MPELMFEQIALLLLGAALLGTLGAMLRQPVIVSFIAIGILASAIGQANTEIAGQIAFLAELGVVVLLFLVGLKLDVGLVRTIGPVALATGLGQVFFTAGIGFVICLMLGLDAVSSLYVAVALTFSSTIIIVKLLTDKRELETLHGRIAIGFLIVQDIVVVIAMVVLSTLGIGATGEVSTLRILEVVGALVLMIAGLGLFIRYAANLVVGQVARSPELLVIFAVGWAAAAAAVGELAGFGKELGGLMAGVSLGSTQYREAISSRLASVRDFLLLFFFVALGADLDFQTLGDELFAASVLSLFVLIGNPLIVVVIMAMMGYRARTGFLAGLTVAQISEFSLIFMAIGFGLGHVTSSAVGLVTLVGLVTIAVSVYMITYSHWLYERCQRFLVFFERRPWRETQVAAGKEDAGADVVIFGMGRFGGELYDRLEDAGYRVLGIDLDPRNIRLQRSAGRKVAFGDVTDEDLWLELPLGKARWLIMAIPANVVGVTHDNPHGGLISAARTNRFQGRIVLTARSRREYESLSRSGVDLVLHLFEDAAVAAAKRLTELDEAWPPASDATAPADRDRQVKA